MKYEVYYRSLDDNRSPEVVILENEYRHVGTIKASSRREVERKLLLGVAYNKQVFEGETRAIRVGDILLNEQKEATIFTPMGSWAIVQVIEDGDEDG
jgi:hypothetical protein